MGSLSLLTWRNFTYLCYSCAHSWNTIAITPPFPSLPAPWWAPRRELNSDLEIPRFPQARELQWESKCIHRSASWWIFKVKVTIGGTYDKCDRRTFSPIFYKVLPWSMKFAYVIWEISVKTRWNSLETLFFLSLIPFLPLSYSLLSPLKQWIKFPLYSCSQMTDFRKQMLPSVYVREKCCDRDDVKYLHSQKIHVIIKDLLLYNISILIPRFKVPIG
jgi:hypothetical protein